MKNLVWFRRDLRIDDNSALFHASQQADEGLLGVYFITPKQWKEHDDADSKVSFWLKNLHLLSESLTKLNISLIVKSCDTYADVPKKILSLAKRHKCDCLFFNREYEINEARRDNAVAASCDAAGISVQRFHDRVIAPPREIATKENRFYSVFTPYRKVWDTKALDFIEPLPKPKKQLTLDIKSSLVPGQVKGFDFSAARSDLWPAGEAEARKRLKKFATRMMSYDEARDIPSASGTSFLSPYLAAGIISPRHCMAAALACNGGKIAGKNDGARIWISELTWRDFYTHVLVGFPRVSMHQPFKPKTESVAWRRSEQDFSAWKNGQTGYPVVDAGMRQLNRTGWMHNRLRMVTAMFLTKHLLIDWRYGERYFMQKLVDGDLAANNGGWQWSASTGTDSVPYFRIFNPFSQSKRFDPDGIFIKKMCPELKDIPAKSLHDAAKFAKAVMEFDVDYPSFIVDYKAGRERALAAFKSIS
jgi:deoxyribodipyrimidine photo-lyase